MPFSRALFLSALARQEITVKDLSKKTTFSRNTLYQKINGKTTFNISQIEEICEILKFDVKQRDLIFFDNLSLKDDKKEESNLGGD